MDRHKSNAFTAFSNVGLVHGYTDARKNSYLGATRSMEKKRQEKGHNPVSFSPSQYLSFLVVGLRRPPCCSATQIVKVDEGKLMRSYAAF